MDEIKKEKGSVCFGGRRFAQVEELVLKYDTNEIQRSRYCIVFHLKHEKE